MSDNWTKAAPPLVVALLLLAGTTVVQGNLSERWVKVDSAIVKRWVDHLSRVPLSFGEWQGREAEKSSEAEKAVAKFEGERPLNFVNEATGNMIGVSLVCGLGRNVSIHTPEKCYLAAGFSLGDQPSRYTIELSEGKKADFYTASFIREKADGVERLRILWAWNDGTGWAAPAWPKVAYARSPALYKMYLICPMPRHDTKITELPIEDFAKQFLPLVETALADNEPLAKASPEPAANPSAEQPAAAEASAEATAE